VEDVDFDIEIEDCARAWHADVVLKDFPIMPDLRRHVLDTVDIFEIVDIIVGGGGIYILPRFYLFNVVFWLTLSIGEFLIALTERRQQ